MGWQGHIDDIVKKVERGIFCFKKNLYSIPIEELLKLNHAIVQPHLLLLLSSVWDNCNKGLRDKLQRLQNSRVGRIIAHSGYEIRSAEIMENLGWKTLEHRWDINKVLLMFKVVNNAAPVYLVSK